MASSRDLARHVAATLAALALTALCLRLLLTDAASATVRGLLPSLRAWPLLLSLALSVAINELRSRRFLLALGGGGPRARLLMFHACAALAFFANVIPFKVGELSFPVLAKRALGIGYAESLGVLVYSRVCDLLTVVALGGLAFAASRPDGAAPGGRLVLPIAAASALALAFLPLLVGAARALAGRFLLSPRLLELTARLFDGCRAVAAPRAHAAWMALTLGSWVLQAACAQLTMLALGARPALLDGFVASGAAAVAFAFPVHGIAGVGPMQAAWAYALTAVGWTWEPALASAFLSHAAILAATALIALATFLVTRRGALRYGAPPSRP